MAVNMKNFTAIMLTMFFVSFATNVPSEVNKMRPIITTCQVKDGEKLVAIYGYVPGEIIFVSHSTRERIQPIFVAIQNDFAIVAFTMILVESTFNSFFV